MSLGSWDPKIAAADNAGLLQPALLQRFMEFDRRNQLSQLEQVLSDEDKQRFSAVMKIDHNEWRFATEALPDNELLQLIRFFTVAENLPGWEAGAKSPVIPLARILRERGMRLDKALLKWLRENNDNRYLPYGAL